MAFLVQYPLLALALVFGTQFTTFVHACCDLDDPISFYRMCTNISARANTPLLVKAINYTQYHDTFDYDPELNPWNAVSITLARNTLRPDCTGDFCNLSGPVCTLIECVPLVQDPASATNDGKTIITDFVVEIPADAGPDGAYYDLAAEVFNTRNYGISIPYVSNNSTSSNSNSSLKYANNWMGFNVTNTEPQPGTNADGFYDFEVHPIEASWDSSWPAYLAIVPCPAYGCARACVNKYYPNVTTSDNSSTGDSQITADDLVSVKDCIGACPGMDTYNNYCPDIGGQAQDLSNFGAESGLGGNWKDFVPDGCARYEGPAFPKAAASLSASLAGASSASWASYTATRTGAAASATSSSQAVVWRGSLSLGIMRSGGTSLALALSLLFSVVV